MRPGGRRVPSGSLGCALGDVELVRGHWVNWGTPLWSSGSFGIVGFIGERPGVVGSFGVAGLIGMRPKGRRVRSGTLGYWGAPCGSSGSFRVAGFIGVRSGGHRVR